MDFYEAGYALDDGEYFSIELPETLESIGERAFYKTKLQSIEIPEGVTEISAYTFYNCEYLESVSLPAGTRSIGNYAFQDCTALTDIYCSATSVPTLGSHVFSYYDSGTFTDKIEGRRLYVPDVTTYLGTGDDETEYPWAAYFSLENAVSYNAFEYDGIYYNVIDSESDPVEVEITFGYKGYSGEIALITGFTKDGVDYVVTSIASDAFEGCEGLEVTVNFIDPSTIEISDLAEALDPKIGTLSVPAGCVGLYEQSSWADYFDFDKEDRYYECGGVYYVFKLNTSETTTLSLKASTSITLEVDHIDTSATEVTIPRSINLGEELGGEYEVSSISENINLKDCTDLVSITLESSQPLENADALNQVPESCVIVVDDEDAKTAYSTILTSVTIYTEEEYKAIVEGITLNVVEKVEVERYNLLGQKVPAPTRGINIVKYSDGTVEKVLVK